MINKERNKMHNKIISYNCDGKWSNLKGILDFISNKNITIALLQDVPANSAKNTSPSLANYNIIGIGPLKTIINSSQVEHNPSAHQDYSSSNTITQTTSVKIKDIYSPITLHNIYIKPRATTNELIKTLEHLEERIKRTGASRAIIMGDFNAIAPEWCPLNKTLILGESKTNQDNKSYINIQLTRGRMISNFINKLKLTCLNNPNTGPTAYNKFQKTEAHIDLAIIGSKCARTWRDIKISCINTSGNQTHGHNIIVIQQTNNKSKNKINKPPLIRTTAELHNNESTDSLNERIRNIEFNHNWISESKEFQIKLLNYLSQQVYEYLQQIQNTNKKRKMRNSTKKYTHLSIKKLSIKLKKLKGKRAFKAKNKITKWINKEAERISLLNPNKPEIWCKIDAYSELDTTNTETTELNKCNINNIMNEKFPFVDRSEAMKIISKDPSNSYNDIMKLPTDKEIEIAIQQISSKKHKGHEGIRFTTFNKQMDNIKHLLKQICKISKLTSTIPDNCKVTLGKIIAKKKKGQFRIVHLATPMLCLIEQIVLHQLEFQIEAHNKINRRQYGFTPNRDRHDLMTRIIDRIVTNKQLHQKKGHSTIISLDIRGAFDNVDHEHLIKKLYDTFGFQSSITKWIAQFLMNKEIILEYQGIRSKKTKICKGVPQGSCLGPTLWNFAIEHILTDLNSLNETKFEIVAYADDIIIIINNEEKNEGQEILNKLQDQLEKIKLEIDPNKCYVMYTSLKKYTQNNKHCINGTPIKEVKDLSILGMHIKYNLRLKNDSITNNPKLQQNIYKLERANALGIINKKQEWNIVINSYIKSILVNNNFPVLAIDKTARKQVANYAIKIYKHIFKWPQNISQKLIRTILEEHSIELQIEKLIYKRIHAEETNGYQLLNQILQNNHIRQTRHQSTVKILRRTPNPNMQLEIKHDTIVNDYWLLIERKNGSLLTHISNQSEIQKIYAITHSQYNIGHFNNMAAITYIVTHTEKLEMDNKVISHPRTITILKNNSLLMALANFKNHDQRVITLRERLIDNNWEINTINQDHYRLWKYRAINYMENNQTTHIQTQLPDVNDYVFNFRKLNDIMSKENIDANLNITSFCRKIYSDPHTWALLNPSWLSGKRMIMLSGLVRNEQGHLEHYNSIHTNDCGCENPHNNWVFHKAVECELTEHQDNDARAKDIINRYRMSQNKLDTIREILEDNHKQQTLLRLLCKISFKK